MCETKIQQDFITIMKQEQNMVVTKKHTQRHKHEKN
jgi:hypothetical protein